MKKIKVLVVDDSAVIRTLFRELLNEERDIEVVDTAVDPLDAREKIKRLNPDVVTLDIEMPKMDGLAFLEKIMALRPTPVIMVSTLTQKGAAETLRALELGAVDYISKPVAGGLDNSLERVKCELAEKIRAASVANLSRFTRMSKQEPAKAVLNYAGSPDGLIAIGSSTGGVEALRDIFTELPGNLPPIVMTQHMPVQFTGSFASRLNALSAVTVQEAKNGERLQSGHAYLAPGGQHLSIARKGSSMICVLTDDAPVSGHRPSVDVLFSSVAKLRHTSTIGVILTGMGRDGAQGLMEMRNAGAYTLGQNKESSIIYGMPRVAMEEGAVCMEVSLRDVAHNIVRRMEAIQRKGIAL